MGLLTGDDKFGTVERFALAYGFSVNGSTDGAPAATVVVNHGRWIARCPYCRGAELAFRSEWFFCGSCHNEAAAGCCVPAPFPGDQEEIERILLLRPDMHNRHWEPHETVNDLKAENIEHEVPV